MNLSHSDCIDIIAYSLEAIYGEVIKLILALVISILGGFFLESLMVIIGFCMLRTVAGGFHMKTLWRCAVITIPIIITPAFISLYIDLNIYILVGIILISLLLGYLYAPVGSEEKPIDSDEKKYKYKKKSMIYIVAFSVISICIYLLEYNTLAFSLILGVFVECFTLTPIGLRMFNVIERVLKG